MSKALTLLLVRLTLSTIFMLQGLSNIIWPDYRFAILIGIIEAIASILLFYGFYNKLTSIILGFLMLGAIATIHLPESVKQLTFTQGLQADLMIFVACFVIYFFDDHDDYGM
jgi:uncharacterized membrane protein YphA (DoxX/SURF4 family)